MPKRANPESPALRCSVPSNTLRDVSFPECARRCGLVEILGVGECESVCPWKFDEHGNPVAENNNEQAQRRASFLL
jgi:hypothetical protein